MISSIDAESCEHDDGVDGHRHDQTHLIALSVNDDVSRKNLVDYMSVHVGQTAFDPVMVKRELFVIDAQQV